MKVLKREEIDDRYKWDLTSIYKTQKDWDNEYNEVCNFVSEFERYKGKISKNPDSLYECLKKRDLVLQKVEKLFVYAKMKRDEDNSNSIYQSLTDKASFMDTNVSNKIAFIIPEIVSMDEEILDKYMESNEGLKEYAQFFKELLRQKEHTLSTEVEGILALASDLCSVSEDVFTMFNNADIKFPFIKNEDGKLVELTKGRYIVFFRKFK